MKGKTFFLISILLIAVTACQAEPETIIETVVHEVTVEVPQTVEVTREVEVDVEVTRQVEVIKEVPVEVTRVIELVVTATPSPTLEPTATATPVPAAVNPPTTAAPPPASGVTAELLQASYGLRTQLYRFKDEGMNAGNCFVIVESDNYFNSAPGFDVSGSSNEVQTAYAFYQEAKVKAIDATLGISQGCRDAIASGNSFTITYLNLLDINGKADVAIGKLDTAIGILEPLAGE